MLTQEQIITSIKYYDNQDTQLKRKSQYREKNRELLKRKERMRKEYKYSWGGDARSNNNLLSIDINLFH